MAGGFTCPHCDTFNRCCCKGCKETYLSKGKTDGFVSWDEAGELCICFSCNKKFHEGQSLDIEWDRMIADVSKTLTKEICYEWLFYVIKKEEKPLPTGVNKYRLKEYDMYNTYGFKEEWFARSFGYHFKVSAYTIAKSGIAGLRDLQIDKILDGIE